MSVSEVIQSYTAIGFSGSRHSIDPSAGNLAAAAVRPGADVLVGCAAGVDAFFRAKFPAARVFRADRSLGRGGFAKRSIECVEAVRDGGGLWVSFPSRACPAGLVPSSRASRCFCGTGSGSWASLAYAIGLGVPVLVFTEPALIPASWCLVSVSKSGNWYESQPITNQLSLI